MDIGKKIKELRKKAGMTLEELAGKAGLDSEHVRGAEDYLGSLCSFETIEQIFRALDCELRVFRSGGGWRTVDKMPQKTGEFYECVVLIPCSCGRFERRIEILYYGLGWDCKGIIVTHWREIPKPPEIWGGLDGA